jgi:hypothetical protein
MKVQLKESDWTTQNGKEVLWYAEHHLTKRVFFTSPMSPLPYGYIRHSTTNPKEMDRIFNRMHEQEREQNQKIVEGIYNRGREYYDRMRSALRQRLQSSGVSDAEKGIIRESLKLMDEKDSKMQQNTVYGISAMQESPAPLPGPAKRVM